MNFDETEESIFTLFSLYLLITQAFDVLSEEESINRSNGEKSHFATNELKEETIREALIYQILLKSCSFLDEWNEIFGVKTSPKDSNTILGIKRIAKPASKCITEWKHLKTFRNEVIAHNFRNKEGRNIFWNNLPYNSPQTIDELFLLVFCIKKMIDITTFFFKDKFIAISKREPQTYKIDSHPIMSAKSIKERIDSIDKKITDNLMRENIFSNLISNSNG